MVQGDLISKVKATKANLAAAELTANSESKENKKESGQKTRSVSFTYPPTIFSKNECNQCLCDWL